MDSRNILEVNSIRLETDYTWEVSEDKVTKNSSNHSRLYANQMVKHIFTFLFAEMEHIPIPGYIP